MKQSIGIIKNETKPSGAAIAAVKSLRRRVVVATAVTALGILPLGFSAAHAQTPEQIRACAQTMMLSVCIAMLK